MKHALKVNKWLEGVTPSQIPTPSLFFSFLSSESQTKTQMMSWGHVFGKCLVALSQDTSSPFTNTVLAFHGGAVSEVWSRTPQLKAGSEEWRVFADLQIVPLSSTRISGRPMCQISSSLL